MHQTIALSLLQRKNLFFDGSLQVLGYLGSKFVAVQIGLNQRINGGFNGMPCALGWSQWDEFCGRNRQRSCRDHGWRG